MTGRGVPRVVARWRWWAGRPRPARSTAVGLAAVLEALAAAPWPDARVAALAALVGVARARLALGRLTSASGTELGAAATKLALLAADLRVLQRVTVGLRAGPVGAATCWEARWDAEKSVSPARVTPLRPERGNADS